MFVMIFLACNPNEDIYDDLDEKNAEYEGLIENYVLTAADYSTASGVAKKDAVSVGDLDSTYAKLIKSMEAFNSYYSAEDYVGSVLAKNFGEYGNGSRAYVTYNYVAELPEDLAVYSDATIFELEAEEYENVDELVAIAGYLYPNFNPDFYIADVLTDAITGAVANDIYCIKYKYSDVNPVIAITSSFEEGFTTGLGKFDSTSVTGSKGWYASSYGSDFFAKMSGYQQVNDDWLISNPIVLGNDANIVFNFTHAIKYLNYHWEQLTVAISTDYNGSDIAGATWDVIDWGDVIDTTGATIGTDYTFYSSGDIDISAYANNTIYIGFKYISDLDNAPTWEIKDVTVTPIEPVYAVSYGKTPITKSDFYEYDGSDWSKVEGVYCLNEADYEAMGDPGIDNMFSSDILPQDYLPKFLDAKYPEAGSGVEKTIVYQYDSDIEEEITIATTYEYGENGWESDYDYIQVTTNQFVHNGEEWLFDPTISRELSSADYQIIVDYVKNEYGDEFLDSYKTADYIYGTSAYYSEFNIANYDEEKFGGGDNDWQNAVKEALGEVLLPILYPDAQLQVNGVNMYYRPVFLIYDSGTMTNYAIKFQVTKAGPEPEFTFDEDYGFQEVK